MKQATLSFETVSDKINEMILAGEKPTVRNILAKTGGKTSIIAEYLKRWHVENTALPGSFTNQVSKEVLQALQDDKEQTAIIVSNSYKAQITKLEGIINELNAILKERETLMEMRETELSEFKEMSTNQNALLMAQIEVKELSLQEMKQHCASMQTKLNAGIAEKHEALTQAAVWQAKFEQLQGKE